ncbi:DNA polymerase III subunit beta, partial [Candidatus Shapirobacteria bacterium CG_4_9_14_0_2_um_filter_40_11]
AVKIVSVFARESANIVKFEAEDGVLKMSANSPQVGENTNNLEVKLEGEKTEIAFNFRFLQAFLNAVTAPEIIIETNGSLSPCVFKESGNNDFLHIIMPVRLQTE